METTPLFSWILVIFATTCHPYRGDVDPHTCSSGVDVIPLSMMRDSAAYIYTRSNESDRLATEYLAMERKIGKELDEAWTEAFSRRQNDTRLSQLPVPPGLREEHVVAIIAYTFAGEFYGMFNAALRMYGANDSIYAEKFPFKAFQYLLSVAIARLREDQGETPQPTYRRMTKNSSAEVGFRMKFGQFASSSCKQGLEGFGNKTIFTIFSQYGALIQNYSFKPDQEEVLIPPYEAFKITSCKSRPDGVDISLQTDGEAGIPVSVERGSKGQMIVLRCEGTANFRSGVAVHPGAVGSPSDVT